FETAVARSGTGAALSECLFVTEAEDHLTKCAEFEIAPVHFGPATAGMTFFQEWADAPAAIAGLVAPGHGDNHAAAVATALASRFGMGGSPPTRRDGRTLHGRASHLIQLNDPRLGTLNGVYVERPADVTVELGPDGRVASVAGASPDPD